MANEEYGEEVIVETEPVEQGAVAEQAVETSPVEGQSAQPQQTVDPQMMLWMQQQQLAQQVAQQQQYQAYLAAQLQAAQMSQRNSMDAQEEIPDPAVDPDKYIEWKLKNQFAPIQNELQTLKQQQAYNNAMSRAQSLAMQPQYSDWRAYEDTIVKLANQVPLEQLAADGTWEMIYFIAKGYATSNQNKPPEMMPQGQFPGVKQQAPVMSGASSVNPAPAPSKRVKLSAEQVQAAKSLGLTPAEYAKYL